MKMLIDSSFLIPVMRQTEQHIFKACINGSILGYLTETVFKRIST